MKFLNLEHTEIDETIVKVETWYDRHQRIWVTQLKNKDGYQIGNTIYSFTKEEAKETTKELKAEYGIQ